MPLSRHSVGTYPETELSRNLLGNIRPQSSRRAEPLWSDLGIMSAIHVRELISTFEKKKAQAGNEWLNILNKNNKILARKAKAIITAPVLVLRLMNVIRES